jgi:ketopantoate reductase/2-keto-4-pentenoate hydratase/2-oxohepta-3-ene-1,7-dioic acid hydratase in catechol pathway
LIVAAGIQRPAPYGSIDREATDMAHWLRFSRNGSEGFGTLSDGVVSIHSGDMFAGAEPTGEMVALADVEVLTPCQPSKMICLWNNFHELAAKLGTTKPVDPLYFLKAPSAFLADGQAVHRPSGYAGNVVFEGELGIVIGKRCANISEAEAAEYIFGYTCVNDVTAADILNKDPSFPQWARAKSFDSFGVFGPVVATGLDPMELSIRTVVDGKERQNYPVSDMFYPPEKLVARLSEDMTLMPGDVIACGTSVGVGAMRKPVNKMEVTVNGVGTLTNEFVQQVPFRYSSEVKPMRICVVGAGAIGGLMAAKLATAGHPVTVIDQGGHLEAIRENGLKLIWEDGSEIVSRVKAVSSAAEAGEQDMVILAVKAHYLEGVVRDIEKMLHDETMIMTVQNGLPWWYFQRLGGDYDGQRMTSLDPSGILTRKIEPERIIGSVVYPAASVEELGVIHHVEGDRFPVGELDGSETERVKWVHDVLVSGGLKSRVLSDIRGEIWLKAWGNLSFNPISALSHATLVAICQFPETRQLAADMMGEAQAVAEKLGVTFRHTIEKRIAGAESVGAHKTSMLQDVEVGRSLETEALVGSILEMAELTDTPAPSIKAVYACVKLLNKVMLTEGAGVRMAKEE